MVFCFLWVLESGFHFNVYWQSVNEIRVFLEFLWPPNLSSSCNNIYWYVKLVSIKSVIFGRYKMLKKPLRIHAKSLSDALAPSKRKVARGAGLRRLCEASTFIVGVPIVCQILARKAGGPNTELQEKEKEIKFTYTCMCVEYIVPYMWCARSRFDYLHVYVG